MKPPEPEIREFASAWLAKALVDLLVCDSLIAQDARLWEAVTFHCQQAVEKALNAVLVWHQVGFPRPTTCSVSWTFSPMLTPKSSGGRRRP
jgi:HEPN domain-containing protein